RRNLGDFADEGPVFVGFHFDAGLPAQLDLADIALIDFTLDVDLARIAQGHDQRGRRTEYQDRADRAPDFYIAGEYGAVDGRNDGGVTEFFFFFGELGLGLRDLRLRLAQLRRRRNHVGLSQFLLVDCQLVILLRVIERGRRNHTFLGHLLRALVSPLQHGDVRPLRVKLGMVQVGFGCAGGSFGGLQSRPLLVPLSHDLLLVELGENLSFLHRVSVIHEQALYNATGFGFDLYVGNRLNFARGDHALG